MAKEKKNVDVMNFYGLSTPVDTGNWVLEKRLGSGGFGVVVLFTNKDTGQSLALKKCKLASEMSQRSKERWQMECDIMLRLSHDNVVGAFEVPAELNHRATNLAFLAMEYCRGGDLRQELGKGENCCGMSEAHVRTVAGDVGKGVEFLHSKRIVHRDLKPENILLQPLNGGKKFVCKITDLGYAKELQQDSWCYSFVGTLQYVAPELISSSKYTATVDYWSLGTLMFECIAGCRPFFDSEQPVKWHLIVQTKTANHIHAFHDHKNEVVMSEKIPSPNHLCRPSQLSFEKWLRLMLDWDAFKRGGSINKPQRPECFTMLDQILEQKLIHIYCVAMNQRYTYAVDNKSPLRDTISLISQETKIPQKDQQLLLITGVAPDVNEPAIHFVDMENQSMTIYQFSKKSSTKSVKMRAIPVFVQEMIRQPNSMYTYKRKKKAWAQAVYYCTETVNDYVELMDARKAMISSYVAQFKKIDTLRNQISRNILQLETRIDFFQRSYALDMQRYADQAVDGISSAKMEATWRQNADEVERFSRFKKQLNNLEMNYSIFQTKLSEFQKSPFANTSTICHVMQIRNQAVKLYVELKKLPKEEKSKLSSNEKMTECVCKMSSKELTDKLIIHIGNVFRSRDEMVNVSQVVQDVIINVQAASERVMDHHLSRQKEIWKILNIALKKGGQNLNLTSLPPVSMQDIRSLTDETEKTIKESGSVKAKFEEELHSLTTDQTDGGEKTEDWAFLAKYNGIAENVTQET